MPVRIAARPPEKGGDSGSEIVRDYVLDALGLRMHAFQRHIQRAMEKGFEQAVPAHHRDRERAPFMAEPKRLGRRRLGLQETVAFQEALCLTHRDSAHVEVSRYRRCPYWGAAAKLIDRLDVVLARPRRGPVGSNGQQVRRSLVTHG
jgi:hypothetical protein